MKLLHINASPRAGHSRTLKISDEYLNEMKRQYPDIEIDTLDLFKLNLPEVLEPAVDAKYTSMSGGTLNEQSQKLWDEITAYAQGFVSYDRYLITAPMWNFTIPYKLKQYIDIIMQAGILFKFTETGTQGLAQNKKMVCISSSGSDYSAGSPIHQYDFQEPYLKAIFGFAGIYDISFIHAQPLDHDPALTATQLAKAIEEAKSVASNII